VVDGVPDLVLNSDRARQLAADAEEIRSSADLRDGQSVVEETRQRLEVNVSEELALEQLASRVARRVGG
jgi:hypothetical protein